MTLIEELAIEFGATRNEIAKLVGSAPRRYKVYEIDKRDGGKRVIAQPASEIKALQRYVLQEKLSGFPVHEIAAAYVPNRSIRDNADIHAKSQFVLKLDFRAFFPSIVPRDLERVNRRTPGQPLRREDLEAYYHLLFWGEGTNIPKRLSIGAPTSPAVSNIVMFSIDCEMYERASRLALKVSRYADDITVSGDKISDLIRFEKSLRQILKTSISPKLTINEEKRGIYGRGERRLVTGLVITPDGRVSLGRERKRAISSMIHRVLLHQADHDQIMYTKGMLGFAISSEPDFVSSMRRKYGNDLINDILAAQPTLSGDKE